jgi:hypothetical protein
VGDSTQALHEASIATEPAEVLTLMTLSWETSVFLILLEHLRQTRLAALKFPQILNIDDPSKKKD